MKAKKPLSSSGAFGMNSRYQERISSERSSGNRVGPATTSETGLSLNAKRVTTPKLPPPPQSAQKRSECWSSFCGDEAAVRKDDVGLDQIVDRQPELASHVPDAAAERKPGDAGRRDDSEGRGQPEGLRRVVDLSEQRPSQHLCDPDVWIDDHAAQGGKVDHEPVVHAAQPGPVVRATVTSVTAFSSIRRL
jgi:hypothetical protein